MLTHKNIIKTKTYLLTGHFSSEILRISRIQQLFSLLPKRSRSRKAFLPSERAYIPPPIFYT